MGKYLLPTSDKNQFCRICFKQRLNEDFRW